MKKPAKKKAAPKVKAPTLCPPGSVHGKPVVRAVQEDIQHAFMEFLHSKISDGIDYKDGLPDIEGISTLRQIALIANVSAALADGSAVLVVLDKEPQK